MSVLERQQGQQYFYFTRLCGHSGGGGGGGVWLLVERPAAVVLTDKVDNPPSALLCGTYATGGDLSLKVEGKQVCEVNRRAKVVTFRSVWVNYCAIMQRM